MSIITTMETVNQLSGNAVHFLGCGFDKTDVIDYKLDKIRVHFESKIEGSICLRFKDFEQIDSIIDGNYQASDQGGSYTQMLELTPIALIYNVNNQIYQVAYDEVPASMNFMDCKACVINDSAIATKIKVEYFMTPI